MWRKLSDFLKLPVLKNSLKGWLLNALGITGGVSLWIIAYIFSKAYGKVEKEVESEARVEDRAQIDNANADQYAKDKAEGAPIEKLKQDELDMLNGANPIKPK